MNNDIFEKIKKKNSHKYSANGGNFKVKIKKGTCFFNNTESTKNRMCVVLKVIDDMVIFNTLTKTDNIHKFLPVDDENFPDSYYTYGLYICHIDDVKRRLIQNRMINDKSINLIKRKLKLFFIMNL